MAENIEEAKELTQEEQEKLASDKMYAFLSETFGSDAPTEEKVKTWKERHGRVRLLPLSDEEVYFVRPVRRSEYKALLDTTSTSGTKDKERFLAERIVALCVLWPIMDAAQFGSGLAGTVESLYTIIMDASNFISPEALFTVVREL